MKVALYCRVSTEDRGQDTGVQKKILTELAESRGYEIVAVYEDHASGKDPNRPQFKDMMAAARKHRFDAVMAVRIDRIMRSVTHLNNILQELKEYNVQLIFTDMNLDLSNPSNKLIFNIVGAIAEWERQIISTRTKEGLAFAKKKGKVLGRNRRDDVPLSDILRMRSEGMGWGTISKTLGIPQSTIIDHVRKWEKEVNGKGTS